MQTPGSGSGRLPLAWPTPRLWSLRPWSSAFLSSLQTKDIIHRTRHRHCVIGRRGVGGVPANGQTAYPGSFGHRGSTPLSLLCLGTNPLSTTSPSCCSTPSVALADEPWPRLFLAQGYRINQAFWGPELCVSSICLWGGLSYFPSFSVCSTVLPKSSSLCGKHSQSTQRDPSLCLLNRSLHTRMQGLFSFPHGLCSFCGCWLGLASPLHCFGCPSCLVPACCPSSSCLVPASCHFVDVEFVVYYLRLQIRVHAASCSFSRSHPPALPPSPSHSRRRNYLHYYYCQETQALSKAPNPPTRTTNYLAG